MSDSQHKPVYCPMLTHLKSQRYVFSTILSFLNECDGTSALITNKTWTRLVLGIYCIPLHILTNTTPGIRHPSGLDARKKRHKFIVVPVQDPSVLLDRLNTTRLAKRLVTIKTNRKGYEGGTKCGTEHLDEDEDEDEGGSQHCYPKCMTTDEIAWYEWNLSSEPENYEASSSAAAAASSSSSSSLPSLLSSASLPLPSSSSSTSKIPVNLELLRYRKPTIQRNPTPKQLHRPRPEILPGTTLLASYPRSGNTLLRNLLERTLNIVTGSDTRPDRNLSKDLALKHNLVGEGITSPSLTPVVKTHFPERRGRGPFDASRVILLVRNPYDAIDSYWNMCCTNTHTESVVEDVYDQHAGKFRGLARSEIHTWMDFLKYWVIDGHVDAERARLPTLIVRYEDLILQTKSVMEEVMTFLLYGNNTEGKSLHPFWRWRVHHSLDISPNINSNTPSPQSTDEKVHVSTRDTEPENLVQCDRGGIDTTALGSYKPRTISETNLKPANDCHNDSKSLHSKIREQSECRYKGRTAISSIGKSLKKNRYSDDTIRHIHNVANEEKYHIGKGDNVTTLLQLFGYDILSHHFPLNFGRDTVGDCVSSLLPGGPECTTIKVNVGSEIRLPDDPFGRAMTNWRRGHTDQDRDPFLTLNARSKAQQTDARTQV